MLRRALRLDLTILAALGYARPYVNWSFLVVGVAGTVGTAAGWLPPFTANLWGRVSTSVVWGVLAMQGYDGLAQRGEEEIEEDAG